MGSMAVTVLIDVVGRDSLAPGCTTLELNVPDVDASIDNIDIDAVTTVRIVNILSEGAESELRSVTDARKTLISTVIGLAVHYGITC